MYPKTKQTILSTQKLVANEAKKKNEWNEAYPDEYSASWKGNRSLACR